MAKKLIFKSSHGTINCAVGNRSRLSVVTNSSVQVPSKDYQAVYRNCSSLDELLMMCQRAGKSDDESSIWS